MADIDFIIHPQHAKEWYSGEEIFESKQESYDRYISELEDVVKNSSYPVLVETIDDRDSYFADISIGHLLHSDLVLDHDNKKRYNFGFVHNEEWLHFLDIMDHAGINKNSKIRIHGSYINECVSQFAKQLIMYLHFGVHSHDFSNSFYRIIFDENILTPIVENIGLFQMSDIRYGVTLSPRIVSDDVLFMPRGPSIVKLFGDYQFQLYDRNDTKIFS